MEKNKKMSGGKMVAVGAGIALAGAGAYYLLGPKAKAHQKKAKVLIAKMQKEVASEIKKVKEITPPLYHQAVDVISKNYAEQYKLHEKDIQAFAKKMKSEWKGMSKIIKKPAKTSKKKKV